MTKEEFNDIMWTLQTTQEENPVERTNLGIKMDSDKILAHINKLEQQVAELQATDLVDKLNSGEVVL